MLSKGDSLCCKDFATSYMELQLRVCELVNYKTGAYVITILIVHASTNVTDLEMHLQVKQHW